MIIKMERRGVERGMIKEVSDLVLCASALEKWRKERERQLALCQSLNQVLTKSFWKNVQSNNNPNNSIITVIAIWYNYDNSAMMELQLLNNLGEAEWKQPHSETHKAFLLPWTCVVYFWGVKQIRGTRCRFAKKKLVNGAEPTVSPRLCIGLRRITKATAWLWNFKRTPNRSNFSAWTLFLFSTKTL